MARGESSEGAPNVERAFERIAEDEALRGDLSDRGYDPLLSWVAAVAVARAACFRSTDALYLALRGLVAGVVEAARRGSPEPLLAALTPALFSTGERKALRQSPPALDADPDTNVVSAVRCLAAATGIAAPEENDGAQ